MPELPEVETVRAGLERAVVQRIITAVDQRRADLRQPFPENLSGKLTGRKIISVRRRAKYLLVHLDNGTALLLHLGMSGRILITKDHVLRKHDHLILILSDGTQIVFNDARRFGLVLFVEKGGEATHPALAPIGPEPLGDDFTGAVLSARLKGKKTPIKTALLDQRVVAGVGNIYACEALFEAGIHPERLASTVKGERAERLVTAVKNVLTRAIAAGGSTLRDYRQAGGEMGYFQHNFTVYDRAGEKCPGCDCKSLKTGGIRRLAQAGRSTFFCPRKQT